MNQKQLLLTYLKEKRFITPLEALSELGVYRLSDCVHKLRKDGWQILTHKVKSINRHGRECEYANYQLMDN